MQKLLKKVIPLSVLFTFCIVALAFAYVGNSRSHIFHYDDCRYVSRMNAANKVYFEYRENAINAGYRGCKVCNP